MYIYHALINALCAHMIHINLNMIFYTHVEISPNKTVYIKYYTEKQINTRTTRTNREKNEHQSHDTAHGLDGRKSDQ